MRSPRSYVASRGHRKRNHPQHLAVISLAFLLPDRVGQGATSASLGSKQNDYYKVSGLAQAGQLTEEGCVVTHADHPLGPACSVLITEIEHSLIGGHSSAQIGTGYRRHCRCSHPETKQKKTSGPPLCARSASVAAGNR